MIISTITDFFKKNSYIFISVLIFGLFAHGYCYFNMNFSHDSINFDHSYSLELGRWGQNIIYAIRGTIFPPVLVGFLSLLFIAFATIIYSKIFEINNKIICILISGLFVTNFSYTYIAATYMFFLDVNMLAFMLATLAVYLVKNYERSLFNFFASSFILLFAISLYQVYLQVYFAVVVLLFIQEIVKNKPLKDIFKQSIALIVVAFIAVFLYYLSLKILNFSGVEFSNNYNSINRAGLNLNIIKIYHYILKVYGHLPSYNYKVQLAMLILLCLYSIYLIVNLCKQYGTNIIKITLSILSLIILLPLASNCVYAISDGLMHSLMKYSYSFIFLVPVTLLSETESSQKIFSLKTLDRHSFVIYLLVSIVLFNSAIFSNQVYWQKDLQSKASLSIMTRILSQLDDTEEYTPKMSTCFAGSYFQNDNILKRDFLNSKLDNTGITNGLSFTYNNFAYINNFLRTAIKPYSNCRNFLKDNEKLIDTMPIFPQKGYIFIVNNTAIIKMSEKINGDYGNGLGN